MKWAQFIVMWNRSLYKLLIWLFFAYAKHLSRAQFTASNSTLSFVSVQYFAVCGSDKTWTNFRY